MTVLPNMRWLEGQLPWGKGFPEGYVGLEETTVFKTSHELF